MCFNAEALNFRLGCVDYDSYFFSSACDSACQNTYTAKWYASQNMKQNLVEKSVFHIHSIVTQLVLLFFFAPIHTLNETLQNKIFIPPQQNHH